PGLINLDFADVKSVMSGAGSALMGIGSARGDNRALLAAEQAIASPLLEASMEGAHGVLLSISGGSDLGLFEINEADSLVSDAAPPMRPSSAPAAPQAAVPPPSAPMAGTSAASRPGTGGPITVPPLPPINQPVANSRRPLSNEDFEEELDVPEFLRST